MNKNTKARYNKTTGKSGKNPRPKHVKNDREPKLHKGWVFSQYVGS